MIKKSRHPKPKHWVPTNKHKYAGDWTNIITRSSWETRFMNYADRTPSIVKWNSEEIKIPYYSELDGKHHLYYVDFTIIVADKNNKFKTYLVEIKPFDQCNPPKQTKNKKRYLNEVQTFITNQLKWKAATNYAKQRGWEFVVLNEFDLGIAAQKK